MNFPSAVTNCRPSSLGEEEVRGLGVTDLLGLSRLIWPGEVLVADFVLWIVLTKTWLRLGDVLFAMLIRLTAGLLA